jgi:small basic protein
MLITVIAILIGMTFGIMAPFVIPPAYSVYVAIAILAALDSVLGSISAYLNKTFDMTIFLSGFFGNALLAAFIIFLGERLGLDLYIAVVVVFGTRLFQNFAIIRRFWISMKWKKKEQ